MHVDCPTAEQAADAEAAEAAGETPDALAIAVTASAVGVLAILGVMATGVATWCYFVVVTERGPGFLSTINYLIPAVAFAAGTVLLAEPWGWEHLLALFLILIGVGLIQVRRAV